MAFATVQQLVLRWQPLTTDQQDQAAVLLDDASRDLTRLYPDAVVKPELADDLQRIACNMVRREMSRIMDGSDGIISQSETRGPFSSSRRYVDPEGGMYVTGREEEILLGKPATSGGALPLWGDTCPV